MLLAVLDIAIGGVVALFNFHGYLRHLAQSRLAEHPAVAHYVIRISLIPKSLLDPSGEVLYRWLSWCFLGLWCYFGVLVLVSFARGRFGIAGLGLLAFVLGIFSLSALSWTGVLVWGITWVLVTVIGFIGHLLGVIVGFLGMLLTYAFPVLAILAGIAALVFLWKWLGPKRLALVAVGLAVLYLLRPVLREIYEKIVLPVLRWVRDLLATIFGWLGVVLAWVLKVVAIAVLALSAAALMLGLVGSIGQIIMDQLRTAWETGRSRMGVLLGSFSLGASLALILLVSAGSMEMPAPPAPEGNKPVPARKQAPVKKGRRAKKAKKATIPPPAPVAPPLVPIAASIDQAWNKSGWILRSISPTALFMGSLPGSVRRWAQQAFTSASAPTFDAAFLALAIIVSILGLLRGLAMRKEFPLQIGFHNRDMLALAALPLLVIVLVLAASQANQD